VITRGETVWEALRVVRKNCFIHFSYRNVHASHYIGMSGCLDARLALHRAGNGARLMEVVTGAGIAWEVARLWPVSSYEEARLLERKPKHTHGHGPALCPICQHKPLDPYTLLRQGHYPLALHNQVGRRRLLGRW
jgi:predicted GIY-YIG superfamily endonuclease